MSFDSTENGRSQWREIVNSTTLIIKSNSFHFKAISIIFLFPIFFTLIVYPSFHLTLFHPNYDFTIFTQVLPLTSYEIIALIVYTLFAVLFFLFAVATITNSSVQAFHDRPINIFSSIKSIKNSFFPLLSTFIVTHTIFISITLLVALILMLLSKLIELKYDSNHFLALVIFGLIILIPILNWLQLNWSLAYVIAIVESKSGFETLRRSSNLVKGKIRWIAFWSRLFYSLVIGGSVVGGSMYLVIIGTSKVEEWWWLLGVIILQIWQGSVTGYVMMKQYLVVNAVLYMYSKDLNDEKLSFEIGDNEFGEYESL